MKKNGVREFLMAVNNSVNLRTEVLKLRKKYPDGELSAQDAYDFLSKDFTVLARNKGYNFTVEEYINYQMSREIEDYEFKILKDNELSEVSGGFYKQEIFPWFSALIGKF